VRSRGFWIRCSTKELKNFRAPTLFIWGEREQLASLQIVNEMAALIPKARVELIADAGHIVGFDQPEQCAKLTIEFLKSQ
jgi:pimeloyl-ACP methyl ester carboxylesterase